MFIRAIFARQAAAHVVDAGFTFLTRTLGPQWPMDVSPSWLSLNDDAGCVLGQLARKGGGIGAADVVWRSSPAELPTLPLLVRLRMDEDQAVRLGFYARSGFGHRREFAIAERLWRERIQKAREEIVAERKASKASVTV